MWLEKRYIKPANEVLPTYPYWLFIVAMSLNAHNAMAKRYDSVIKIKWVIGFEVRNFISSSKAVVLPFVVAMHLERTWGI